MATIYVAVIDDHESFRQSLARLLWASNYQPITYSSAEAYLADTKHPKFDCLLLDIALEGISGLELARRLASVGSRVPIIYLTAHDDPATREAAQDTGCVAFLSKLESSEALLQAVASAIQMRN